MEREIERFHARTDSGKQYTIIAYQNMISVATFDSPRAEVPGMKRLVTLEGLAVNYIDPKTFKIVVTNEIVRKVA